MPLFKKSDEQPKKEQPWRCDMKWVYSILAVFCLSAALIFGAMTELTDEDTGTDVIAHVFAMIVSPKGIDDQTDIDGLRKLPAMKKGEEVKPFPGIDIRVKEADIVGMTPREVRLFLFRQVAKPIWLDGEKGLARVVENENLRDQIKGQGLGPIHYFTRQTHDELSGWMVTAYIVFASMLICAAALSRGFGRLVTPSVILIIGSLWVSIVSWKFKEFIGSQAAASLVPGSDSFTYIGHVLASALAPGIKDITRPSGIAFGAGILGLVSAFIINGAVFAYGIVKAQVLRSRGVPRK